MLPVLRRPLLSALNVGIIIKMQRINISKVLVKSNGGKNLILRGSVWPERPDRSQKPDLPGGLVENGETHEMGALRELQEETGIQLNQSDLELIYADSGIWKSDKAVTRLLYLANVQKDIEITLSWEHEGYWWMEASEVLSLDMRDPYPNIFKYLNETGVLV